ncbi:MAG: DUF4258 domain-containing protein [Chloroflexi bacterium]|nr:DUF4258 domain-containing protein [Chloroflexota bacterium]MYB85381.1 DUF4258 domain-containing protein [Chloroflexota bacterium]
MRLEFTRHALQVMEEREIPNEWVAQAVAEPAMREPDPYDTELERFFRNVPERGSRTLRVVVNTRVAPWRVISVFFDRGMRGRL